MSTQCKQVLAVEKEHTVPIKEVAHTIKTVEKTRTTTTKINNDTRLELGLKIFSQEQHHCPEHVFNSSSRHTPNTTATKITCTYNTRPGFEAQGSDKGQVAAHHHNEGNHSHSKHYLPLLSQPITASLFPVLGTQQDGLKGRSMMHIQRRAEAG